MATSSNDDIPAQLAALLGRKTVRIRKADGKPPLVSIIDVISAITGKDGRHAAEQLRRLAAQYPDVDSTCVHVKFTDARGRKGQKDTPAACVKGVIEIIVLLQGHQAARVRRQAAELLVRWLGGDVSIVDEVCANRCFQDELAARAPEDPCRLFGDVVEAESSPSTQLANLFAAMNQRLTSQEQTLAVQGQLLGRIHERLDQDRQRVNLNVRAPKRAAPHQPPITRDIAVVGRPFPIARFLDEKERSDPEWTAARKNFAPTFGMLPQILKKKKLREEGATAVYIEQNHRPQLFYTEADRPLMEEAWHITAARRDELIWRLASPRYGVAVARPRHTVLDMLCRGAEGHH